MTGRVRIMAGSPEEAAAIQARLATVLNVAGGDRDYPIRNGLGVRRYLEVRLPQERAIRATSTRADRPELER
ncbi:hypothetical protein [Saccharopolyspora pogona]|uniref:hypothetical protein n=1 Tax=Saccharopolyspora pogona TaxID=333966 RepID=UPI001CC243D8|nr:hypothetical protein [Saccharopolyspora pogona]